MNELVRDIAERAIVGQVWAPDYADRFTEAFLLQETSSVVSEIEAMK